MNFNKCSRCGAFFLSENNICPNCQPKEDFEINCLQNFITENDEINYSLDDISASTGISYKNLNRFLEMKQFSDFSNKIKNNQNFRIKL